MTTTKRRDTPILRWRARFSGRVVALVVVMACAPSACDDAPRVTRATTTTAQPTPTVVIFTAHDRVYSEPILQDFERQTGIRAKCVYDAEAAKTTGLINRLLARRDDPECDVLWNNEVVQTEALAQHGVLESYQSPAADRIPLRYRDPQHRWTGFAGRLRVIVYNTEKFKHAIPPATLAAFADPALKDRGVIALPYYGTTFTHVGVLHEQWGAVRLRRWLDDVRRNGAAFAPGNGAACDLVATGERWFGLTDTDDARGAILEGKPIAVTIPDAADGAILIPNTVSLIRGAPHPREARRLIDYLLSPQVERRLAQMPAAQIPLGSDLHDLATPWASLLNDAPPRDLPIEAIARSRKDVIELLRDLGLGQ
ncbi:MAG: extracellular solute-binding protein [Tepidisphaeraceae bacterium]